MAKTKKQTVVKKEKYETPNMKAIRRYQEEIASLEAKSAAANEAHDWSMRNFYNAQLMAKRENLKVLIEKTQKNGNSISLRALI